MPVEWDAVTAEVVAHLRRLIQYVTVNPPGDERPAAEYLQRTLMDEGIETTLLESTAGRPALFAYLRGNGTKAPLLLLAHTDVVGVDRPQWSVDPFGGVVQDGYVYGRGAIDDKGMLAVHLTVMLLLQRMRVAGELALDRDVIFLATPDEESGGAHGMAWLVREHAELLRAEYAINEGGRIRVAPDGSRTLLLQTAEKSSHVVTITAHGPAGHAGVPRPDNAILRLGRALAAISAYAAEPAHGVSPTILRGGDKFNVIPSDAAATMNIRLRPGESHDAVIDHLIGLIGDPDVTVTLDERGADAPASPEDSALFAAIAEAARALDPAITVTPYLSNGITDSGPLRRLGVKAYGILPFPLVAEDEGRMHGHDERVPVESLRFGTQLILDAVRRVAASAQPR